MMKKSGELSLCLSRLFTRGRKPLVPALRALLPVKAERFSRDIGTNSRMLFLESAFRSKAESFFERKYPPDRFVRKREIEEAITFSLFFKNKD